jgi:hypothetical protein
MDFTKLTQGDKILGGAGIVFMISTFLSWFSISGFGISISGNGWDVGLIYARLPFFLVLGMIVWIVLRTMGTIKLPADIPALYLAGGACALLLPLFWLIIGDIGQASKSFGVFVSVLAGAGVAFGGFLKFTEGGGKLDELKSQASSLANSVQDKAKSAIDDAKDSGNK